MAIRAPPPTRVTSKALTGVPKSVASKRRTRFIGTPASLKSTTISLPTWCRLIWVWGSESFTITRPAPSALRRKSIERSSRAPLPVAGLGLRGEAPAPGAWATSPVTPSMTMTVLPTTLVS